MDLNGNNRWIITDGAYDLNEKKNQVLIEYQQKKLWEVLYKKSYAEQNALLYNMH